MERIQQERLVPFYKHSYRYTVIDSLVDDGVTQGKACCLILAKHNSIDCEEISLHIRVFLQHMPFPDISWDEWV